MTRSDDDNTDPFELDIDGVLDLHAFAPGDVKTLVPDYLEECRAKNILLVRIIHGKGKGHLRRSVHALLQRNASVLSFRLADPAAGGWGATEVFLKKSL